MPAERRSDDETSGQVGFAAQEERRIRVAVWREIGRNPREHAWIERGVDDVAFVIGEQQLAGEPARQPPDRGLFREPREQACGGTVADGGFVRICLRSPRLSRGSGKCTEPIRLVRSNR